MEEEPAKLHDEASAHAKLSSREHAWKPPQHQERRLGHAETTDWPPKQEPEPLQGHPHTEATIDDHVLNVDAAGTSAEAAPAWPAEEVATERAKKALAEEL